MLKACKYCGRIHESNVICPKKPRRNYRRGRQNRRDSAASSYRSTWKWKQKSLQIRERDHYLCQACIRGLGTRLRLKVNAALEVHHITPIEEDYDLRELDENLITLCGLHHEEAEAGVIPREQLRAIAAANTEAMSGI